ncbi:MAG TPA: hypothetical protein VFS08_09480 [Gemmatimonadaceae bacterium]|nr:hypothetical protein [Gemmatimonadaceae bacterium]
MPKVLVLFHSQTGHTAALADRIADGARSVRFTEVDVRRLEALSPAPALAPDAASAAAASAAAALPQRYRALDDVRTVTDYDALVLGSPTRHGVLATELALFLERLAPLVAEGALRDVVGSAFTPASPGGADLTLWSILAPLADLGLILVPPAAEPHDQGARVATVAEWVRHAKSHAAGHHHHHH